MWIPYVYFFLVFLSRPDLVVVHATDAVVVVSSLLWVFGLSPCLSLTMSFSLISPYSLCFVQSFVRSFRSSHFDCNILSIYEGKDISLLGMPMSSVAVRSQLSDFSEIVGHFLRKKQLLQIYSYYSYYSIFIQIQSYSPMFISVYSYLVYFAHPTALEQTLNWDPKNNVNMDASALTI